MSRDVLSIVEALRESDRIESVEYVQPDKPPGEPFIAIVMSGSGNRVLLEIEEVDG